MSQPAVARPAGAAAWIVLAAGVSAALHVGKLPPAIPVLREALGIGLVEAGFLLSAVQIAGMTLGLFIGLMADPAQMRQPPAASAAAGVARAVSDYIAGMTDRFAAREHLRLTGRSLIT